MTPLLIATASGSLLGAVATDAVRLDPAAVTVTVAWDISNHGDGHVAAMHMQAEISLDDGITWEPLCSAGRDKGYSPLLNKQRQPITMASVSCSVPPAPSRMVRATLSSTTSVTTFVQISQS